MYDANISTFTRFWNTMQSLFVKCVDAFTGILDFATVPLQNWSESISNPIFKAIVKSFTQFNPYSNYSLAEFMFGSGLVIFIIVAIIKFFADIFT